MSLNTSHAANGVLLYAGEYILLYCDGVTLTMESAEPNIRGSKKGRIYLTTHRMVFRSNEDSKGLLSFSFPFHTISQLGLEQPVFGANFIKGSVKAEPNGGWTGTAEFKMTFKTGGAIEFGQALMAAGKAASRYQAQMPPPPYTPPTQAPYVNATSYMAPAGPAPYGFHIPSNVFPEQPPANQVYMVEQPPPYPGVMGISQTAYMTPSGAGYAPPSYPPAYAAAPAYVPAPFPGAAPYPGATPYPGAAPANTYQQGAVPYPPGTQPAFNPNMGPPPAYSAGIPSKKND